MLDHVAINVRDLSTAKAFYERALEPPGYSVGRPRSRREAPTTVPRASAGSTTRTTTPRSSSTPKATTSRRSANARF